MHRVSRLGCAIAGRTFLLGIVPAAPRWTINQSALFSTLEKTEHIPDGDASTHAGGGRGATKRPPRSGVNEGRVSGPVKDRYPPVTTDLSDPHRRLALLVDATGVSPRVFRNTVLPAALKVGVPVLVRVFAVQLSGEWESLVAGSGRAGCSGTTEGGSGEVVVGETSEDKGPVCPPVEFFRVERFIPVSMQMEADANHIFDFRQQNKIEAIAFVCSEVDRGLFEGFLSNIAGNGFNQYVLDDLGMAKEVLEDGRSANGVPEA